MFDVSICCTCCVCCFHFYFCMTFCRNHSCAFEFLCTICIYKEFITMATCVVFFHTCFCTCCFFCLYFCKHMAKWCNCYFCFCRRLCSFCIPEAIMTYITFIMFFDSCFCECWLFSRYFFCIVA